MRRFKANIYSLSEKKRMKRKRIQAHVVKKDRMCGKKKGIPNV